MWADEGAETDKSESPQLVTSASRDVQLTNHRRQLSADSASSLQSSLLLANINDVELNRLSRHVTTSPLASINDSEADDVNLLDPSAVCAQGSDHTLVQVPSTAAGVASTSEDEDVASAPDEPLLSNAFGNTHCEYCKLLITASTMGHWAV